MSEIVFRAWPKIYRLFRPITITEKIDGSNAAVGVTEDGEVYAQSRKRIITPSDDNFGFARWVKGNEFDLSAILGPGLHFGEWWGSGIQRNYGLKNGERRFSLFNTKRWTDEYGNTNPLLSEVEGLDIVPVFARDIDNTEQNVRNALTWFDTFGSLAVTGFKPVEGIVIYHHASNTPFKVTLLDDEKPKGSNEE